jgi:hypothetical protein
MRVQQPDGHATCESFLALQSEERVRERRRAKGFSFPFIHLEKVLKINYSRLEYIRLNGKSNKEWIQLFINCPLAFFPSREAENSSQQSEVLRKEGRAFGATSSSAISIVREEE